MLTAVFMSTPLAARPGTTITAAHRLPILKQKRPLEIAVQHNPFAPLVDVTPRAKATPTLPPGTAGNTQSGPYTANGQPGAGATAPTMVLCATWFDQAAFRVSTDAPEIAGVGDVVGGYRVAKIDADGVTFTTGERLDIDDCMGATPDLGSGTGAAAPAINPNAPSYVPDPSLITPAIAPPRQPLYSIPYQQRPASTTSPLPPTMRITSSTNSPPSPTPSCASSGRTSRR